MLLEPLDEFGDPGLQGGAVRVVGNSILGFSAFVLQWCLGGFSAGEVGVVPASGGLEAGEPQRSRGVDEEDRVAVGVEADFEQEGSVEDDGPGAVSGGLGDGVDAHVSEERVEEGFEALSLSGVVEDDGGDGGAVDGLIGREDCVPPPLREGVTDVGLGEEGAGLCVGVDDGGALCGEEARDGGFSGADTAGEAEDEWAG